MPITGNLSDFPLPEVLLLLGNRTGCLHLYDLPESDNIDLEVADGFAHALHFSGSVLTEDREIVTQLSIVVGAGAGLFAFEPRLELYARREQPIPINNLVVLMVVYVDEVLSRPANAPDTTEAVYAVQVPLPEMGIDPNLNLFFQQCLPLLKHGAPAEKIASFLGLDHDDVRLNLAYLRQLGFVQIVDAAEAPAEIKIERDIHRKSNQLQLAAEASDLIRRSGPLLKTSLRPAS